MPHPFPQKAIFALIAGAILWFSAGYLLPLFLPFLAGAALAAAAEPMVRLLCGKGRLPRGFAAAVSVSAVCVLSTAAAVLLLAILARQVQNLSGILPQVEAAAVQGMQALQGRLVNLAGRLPGSAGSTVSGVVKDLFSDSSDLFRQAAERLPEIAGSALGGLSKGLFGAVTGILSGYMFSARLPQLTAWLRNRLPDSWQQKYRPLLLSLRCGLGGWFWAEIKLAMVAFVILGLGFWLLRVENPLTIAALVTVVDAFPVLGVGTVLVPWGMICLLQAQTARGIGLLGLFVVIWLARSVLEPKLVGKSIGLDPLLTLVAIYVGFRLWGVVGMLLAPILALMATQVVKQLQK